MSVSAQHLEVTVAAAARDRGDLEVGSGGMESRDCQQMLEDLVRQIATAKLLVPPLLQGQINVSDDATERGGIFRRVDRHVL